MRILLDGSLPRRLSRALTEHTVSTAVEAGWSGVKNGKLLALAAGQFDVFITADRNLQYQQNLAVLPLAVVVLVFGVGEIFRAGVNILQQRTHEFAGVSSEM